MSVNIVYRLDFIKKNDKETTLRRKFIDLIINLFLL